MQAVCDVLEQLVREGTLRHYLAELPGFDRLRFTDILSRHGLQKRWDEWAAALGLEK